MSNPTIIIVTIPLKVLIAYDLARRIVYVDQFETVYLVISKIMHMKMRPMIYRDT